MRSLMVLSSLALIGRGLAAQVSTAIPPAPANPNPAEIPSAPRIELPARPAASPPTPSRPVTAPSDTGYGAILNRPAPPRTLAEFDDPPVLADVPVWYFPKGKLKHQAVVTFWAYIDSAGRVESDSLTITRLSDTSFATAARFTLLGARYRPARWHGHPVRVWVVQTVHYRGDPGRRCELDAVTPLLPTDCPLK